MRIWNLFFSVMIKNDFEKIQIAGGLSCQKSVFFFTKFYHMTSRLGVK